MSEIMNKGYSTEVGNLATNGKKWSVSLSSMDLKGATNFTIYNVYDVWHPISEITQLTLNINTCGTSWFQFGQKHQLWVMHTCQLFLFNRNCPYFDPRKREKKEWFYHVFLFLQKSACSNVYFFLGNSGMFLFLKIFLPFVLIS